MPSANETLLQQYLDAETKILRGQSVRFGDREIRYADLKEIRAERGRLQQVVMLEQRGRRAPYATANFGGTT